MLTYRTELLKIRFPEIVVLAFLSTLLMVSCRDIVGGLIEKGSKVAIKNENTISDTKHRYLPYIRHYELYNQCSDGQVELIGHTVTARGALESPHAKLKFQSATAKNLQTGLQIIGKRSGRYMCFNRKSKLISRVSGISPRCLFREEYSPHGLGFTMLRSVAHPKWYVGFTKKGRPLHGTEYSTFENRRCFFFTKRGHKYLEALHRYKGIVNVEKLHDYLKEGKKSQSSR